MFANLFKPKWQVGTVEQRLAAIEKLSTDQPKELKALQSIVTGDEELRLRVGAIKQFKTRDALDALLKDCSNDETKDAIHKQQINLVGEADLSGLDETQLIEIALQHRQSKLRVLAAEKVTNGGLLEVLGRESKDKAVLRHVKGELKTVREARAEVEAEIQAIDQICESIEHLAGRGGVDQFFLAKYDKAIAQWDEAKDKSSAEQQARFDAAVKACAEDVDRLNAERDEQRAKANAEKAFVTIVATLEQQVAALKQRAPSAAQIQATLDQTAAQWKEAEAALAPTKDSAKAYAEARGQLDAYCITLDQLQNRETEIRDAIKEVDLFSGLAPEAVMSIREKMDPIRKSIRWPEGVASPTLLQHWEQACYKLDQLQRELDNQADEAIRVLARKRRQLDVHIEKGELKVANRIHAQIHHTLEKLWGRELERQAQRLKPLEEALVKLRDWHGFSTTPKKEELCAQMEALAEAQMSPLDLADAIKALQEEWREQTSVNIIEDDPLWERFKEAGNKAYEPCAQYYQDQDKVKQENIQKRRELAGQLEDYIASVDWENADWKQVQKVLRTARDEWKRYEPVRFPDAKPVHKAFFDSVDTLNEKMKTYWQANLEAKEALITKAEELVEVEELQQAMDKAIFLQKQWKELGPTFRSREQKLWKRFRAACDAVFARRDEERLAARAESDANVQEADRLIKAMNALSQLDDEALGKSADEADSLALAFGEVPLPEKLEKTLSNKFNDARRRYEQQFDGIAGRKQAKSLDQLAACAALCDAAESALLDGNAIDDGFTAQFEAALVDVAAGDQAGVQARAEQIQAAVEKGADVFDQQIENQEKLEHIAIELEVLADVDTPEAFKGERMAYQLDKLSDGLGSGKDDAQVAFEINQYRREWYATGAVKPEARVALQLRLEAVLKG